MKNSTSEFVLIILFFLLYSAIVLTPMLYSSNTFLTNDLLANISYFEYFKDIIFHQFSFPQWNPYYHEGIPTGSDPLNSFYNPFIAILSIIFPLASFVKIVFFFSVFFSLFLYYRLLLFFSISKVVALSYSITYASSGYLIARMLGGHFEKIISYPVIPLFLLTFFLSNKKGGKTLIYCSFAIFLFTLSGNLYETLYALLIIGSIIVFRFLQLCISKNMKYAQSILNNMAILGLFLLLSSVRLLPILGNNSLQKSVMPFVGSQSFLDILRSLFIPIPILHPGFFQNSSPFPWWEHFSFIGITPLFCLFIFKKTIRRTIPYEVWIILAIILLFLVQSSLFNPIHWMIEYLPGLDKFRVPSRIYSYLIPITLLISALCINFLISKYSKYKIYLLILIFFNSILTTAIFINTYIHFKPQPINQNTSLALDFIKKIDSNSKFYIAQNVLFDNQIMQNHAVNNNQKILNPNYGFSLKSSSSSKYSAIDFTGSGDYYGTVPKYFIYIDPKKPPERFQSKTIAQFGDVKVYKSALYTPFAYIKTSTDKQRIEVNSDIGKDLIEVVLPKNIHNGFLHVTESNLVGWRLYVDGIEEKIPPGNFLSAKITNGSARYTFKYTSNLFYLGLSITFTSIVFSLFLVVKKK